MDGWLSTGATSRVNGHQPSHVYSVLDARVLGHDMTRHVLAGNFVEIRIDNCLQLSPAHSAIAIQIDRHKQIVCSPSGHVDARHRQPFDELVATDDFVPLLIRMIEERLVRHTLGI